MSLQPLKTFSRSYAGSAVCPFLLSWHSNYRRGKRWGATIRANSSRGQYLPPQVQHGLFHISLASKAPLNCQWGWSVCVPRDIKPSALTNYSCDLYVPAACSLSQHLLCEFGQVALFLSMRWVSRRGVDIFLLCWLKDPRLQGAEFNATFS